MKIPLKSVWLFSLIFMLVFAAQGRTEDPGWKLFSWGLTLAEVDRLYQEANPGMVLREEPSIYEVELTVAPNKSLKIPRGALTAVEAVSRGSGDSAVGRLFGYLWEGKLFGRVVPYGSQPGQSRTRMLRELKAQFPEGRLFHKFEGGLMTADFTLDTAGMLIFADNRGVYLYDPAVLKKVLREAERDRQEQMEREGQRKFQEQGNKPI